MSERIACGKFGEGKARAYLKGCGYAIVEANYRCREGEIDIVARDGECVVFVEVKTRKGYQYGLPCEAVDVRKRGKLILAAQKYLVDNKIESAVRFDVIEVMCETKGGCYRLTHLNHIKNAFEEE